MGDNVARKPIGMVHNAPLASAMGKELQPLILSTLVIHGGQVKRERRERVIGKTNIGDNKTYIQYMIYNIIKISDRFNALI